MSVTADDAPRSMTKAARRSAILGRLSQAGFVDGRELEEVFGSSAATIRRDLDELQAEGYLHRTRGGAVATFDRELPLREKVTAMAAEKQRIAAAAASLAADANAVGFTGGTTTQQVARRLAERSDLSVVTTALNIALEFESSKCDVTLAGGVLRKQTLELIGPLTELVLKQVYLDVVFMGVDGFSARSGLTTHNSEEARTNAVLIERAQTVVVVADSRKIGRTTFASIAPASSADLLITDVGADSSALGDIENAGIRVQAV